MQKALELAIKHNNIILIGEAETKLGRAMIELHDYQKSKYALPKGARALRYNS